VTHKSFKDNFGHSRITELNQ